MTEVPAPQAGEEPGAARRPDGGQPGARLAALKEAQQTPDPGAWTPQREGRKAAFSCSLSLDYSMCYL